MSGRAPLMRRAPCIACRACSRTRKRALCSSQQQHACKVRLRTGHALTPETRAALHSPHTKIYAIQPQAALDTPVLAAVNETLARDAKLVAAWRETNHGAEIGTISNPFRAKRDGADGAPTKPAATSTRTPAAAEAKPSGGVKREPPEDKHAARGAPHDTSAPVKREPGTAEAPSAAAYGADKTRASATQPAGAAKRVRKKRKVIRKEKTKNEKGYTVTRDIEAYESYSSDEGTHEQSAPPAPQESKPAKPTLPRPPPPKSGRAGPKQHSLKSFFGKQ